MTDKPSVLDTVKTLAGIKDNLQDDVIQTLELMTRDQLAMMVDEQTVPQKLEPIVKNVVLARFNRLGNEGYSSYSQEGESISYPSSDFDEYSSTISRYMSEQNRGKIIMW
ncbi:phage head-tail connector protein [Fructobacillus sp. M1-13]|uniref:Phage head-tail connector protein n=1 Tax=Fructobacillus papyriferae TaxID=2713171 RepID=A0ABS5QPB8_9LACO|nr:phage head-tail connector protein [Fructobacillus papyriferae]MBS9335003.1 phage head-tail connector protein [Fructobacillus papyriferae]MCD2159511.1 phage head-tail connector protein [Fructobacillus papyriferae]